MAREEHFVWSDGSPVTFTKWSDYEISSGAEAVTDVRECAHTLGSEPSSLWTVHPCAGSENFVSEVPRY